MGRPLIQDQDASVLGLPHVDSRVLIVPARVSAITAEGRNRSADWKGAVARCSRSFSPICGRSGDAREMFAGRHTLTVSNQWRQGMSWISDIPDLSSGACRSYVRTIRLTARFGSLLLGRILRL